MRLRPPSSHFHDRVRLSFEKLSLWARAAFMSSRAGHCPAPGSSESLPGPGGWEKTSAGDAGPIASRRRDSMRRHVRHRLELAHTARPFSRCQGHPCRDRGLIAAMTPPASDRGGECGPDGSVVLCQAALAEVKRRIDSHGSLGLPRLQVCTARALYISTLPGNAWAAVSRMTTAFWRSPRRSAPVARRTLQEAHSL